MASTPSSADRPCSGAPAACAEIPWKRNLADLLASDVDGLAVVAAARGASAARRPRRRRGRPGPCRPCRRRLPRRGCRRGGPCRAVPDDCEPVLHRQRRRHRARAKEVVPAGVTCAHSGPGCALGAPVLGDPRQCVELGEDADDRRAGAPTGDEGGGHAGDARLDVKAGVREVGLEEGRALDLLVADFGEVPDLLGGGGVGGRVGLDVGEDGVGGGLGGGGCGEEEEDEGCEVESCLHGSICGAVSSVRVNVTGGA